MTETYNSLREHLGPASTDPHTAEKLGWLAGWAGRGQPDRSADDLIRFILSLDSNPTASPHALVTRLFAAAMRAKAFADRSAPRT